MIVVVGNYTFVLHFNEATRDMVLKTFWVNTNNKPQT